MLHVGIRTGHFVLNGKLTQGRRSMRRGPEVCVCAVCMEGQKTQGIGINESVPLPPTTVSLSASMLHVDN